MSFETETETKNDLDPGSTETVSQYLPTLLLGTQPFDSADDESHCAEEAHDIVERYMLFELDKGNVQKTRGKDGSVPFRLIDVTSLCTFLPCTSTQTFDSTADDECRGRSYKM